MKNRINELESQISQSKWDLGHVDIINSLQSQLDFQKEINKSLNLQLDQLSNDIKRKVNYEHSMSNIKDYEEMYNMVKSKSEDVSRLLSDNYSLK